MYKTYLFKAGLATAGIVLVIKILAGRRKRRQQAVQRIADRRRQVTNAAITASIKFPQVTPEKSEAISAMSILELKAALENGSITSEEILLTYIHNIRTHRTYNAVLDTCFDEALREAREADVARARGDVTGLLHGIPISVKDCVSVKGMVCCSGFGAMSFDVQPEDAEGIKMLRKQGAIPFVKTNMCSGGLSSETKNLMFGSVRNPQDWKRSAGGSSGGEACLIALGCSAGGIGTDLAGSIRIPSSACGTFGLKPTSGRFPTTAQYKRSGVPGNLTSWGPMGKSIADLELMMRAVINDEMFSMDHNLVPLPWSQDTYNDTSKLTIGYVLQERSAVPQPSCQERAVRLAKEKLESLGHTLVEFEPLPVDVI